MTPWPRRLRRRIANPRSSVQIRLESPNAQMVERHTHWSQEPVLIVSLRVQISLCAPVFSVSSSMVRAPDCGSGGSSSILLSHPKCASGEIGIRTGFKPRCRETCRYKSCLAHQNELTVQKNEYKSTWQNTSSSYFGTLRLNQRFNDNLVPARYAYTNRNEQE